MKGFHWGNIRLCFAWHFDVDEATKSIQVINKFTSNGVLLRWNFQAFLLRLELTASSWNADDHWGVYVSLAALFNSNVLYSLGLLSFPCCHFFISFRLVLHNVSNWREEERGWHCLKISKETYIQKDCIYRRKINAGRRMEDRSASCICCVCLSFSLLTCSKLVTSKYSIWSLLLTWSLKFFWFVLESVYWSTCSPIVSFCKFWVNSVEC